MITDHLGTRSTQGLCKYIERQDKLEPPKMMKICREMGRPKTHLRSGMWIIGWVCREMPWLKQTSGHQEEHFLHLQLVSWCFTGALTGNPISRWQQHNWQENWYVQTRCFRESKKTEPFFSVGYPPQIRSVVEFLWLSHRRVSSSSAACRWCMTCDAGTRMDLWKGLEDGLHMGLCMRMYGDNVWD